MSLSFIQSLTEESSLGDSSEEVLQRGRGEARIYMVFFWGGWGWGGGTRKYKQSGLNLGKKPLLITKNKHLRLIILVLFYIWKMQEPGVTEILPKMCIDLEACLSKAQSASFCFSLWIPRRRDCGGFQLNPCIGG